MILKNGGRNVPLVANKSNRLAAVNMKGAKMTLFETDGE